MANVGLNATGTSVVRKATIGVNVGATNPGGGGGGGTPGAAAPITIRFAGRRGRFNVRKGSRSS